MSDCRVLADVSIRPREELVESGFQYTKTISNIKVIKGHTSQPKLVADSLPCYDTPTETAVSPYDACSRNTEM